MSIVLRAVSFVLCQSPRFWVSVLYGDIWRMKHKFEKAWSPVSEDPWQAALYYRYWESYGSWVGLYSTIIDVPVFPHGCLGIFISNSAVIGQRCVIFQQVTIGGNSLKDSKGKGAPKIGNDVYIGAGAKIIGNVNVGNNARIGANCIVVKDIPENSVAILRGTEIIHKEKTLNNDFFQ